MEQAQVELKTSIRIYMDNDLKEKMKSIEKQHGLSFQTKIRNFIQQEIKEYESNNNR